MMGRSHDQASHSSLSSNSHHRNVFHLLSRRELCPQIKHVPRRKWGEAYEDRLLNTKALGDAKHGLVSWVEFKSLQHLSAKYCTLVPSPRSTIAAAFSPDGKTLASTHGDHTVKIIDCLTGSCLKVLSGHRRTPWVVRFHPLRPEILASGSLDHEVRLWDTNSADCIRSHDFYRPIASIAFHAEGEILAVASGHKLYIWQHNRKWEVSSPTSVLRTRRSLRAVHFHPHAAPFLLTAEVNDLKSSDTSMTRATSQGYLQYPPPSVYVASVHSRKNLNLAPDIPLISLPSFAINDSRIDFPHADMHFGLNRMYAESSAVEHYDCMESPMRPSPSIPSGPYPDSDSFPNEYGIFYPKMDVMETTERQPVGGDQHQISLNLVDQVGSYGVPNEVYLQIANHPGSIDVGQLNQVISSNSPYRDPGRSDLPDHVPDLHIAVLESGEGVTSMITPPRNGSEAQPISNRIRPKRATSFAATAAAELPCTVKLRVWSHDIKNPSTPLTAERCRLTIPHAVLCSEMGAHFSPCGRFLAVCVACVLPHMEADTGLQTSFHQDSGSATSPTRHPISGHQVMYELRVYSLEQASFGSVLVSRAIRAAHCLTSIQFSPTSEHILLAYGRRHGSLLRSIVIDGEITIPVYTVLEVYRVSDMELVRVLPSSDDEVNVACFHPSAGGGLVYGTKEGKLRVLRYDGGVHKHSEREQ